MSEESAIPESGDTPVVDQSSFVESQLDANDPFLNDFAFEGEDGEVDPASGKPAPDPKKGEPKDKVVKPEPKVKETDGKPEGDDKSKKPPLPIPDKGFPAYFFKEVDGENGEKVKEYDTEKAMKYLLPSKEKRYEPLSRTFAQQSEKKPEPDKSPAEQRAIKKADYIKNTRASMNLASECIREAIGKGYKIEEAMAYADNMVGQALQKDLEEYELKMEIEREKEYDQRFDDKIGNKEIDKNVRTNTNTVINSIASVEDLTPQEATDKYISILTHGQPIIDHFFDFANPGLDTGKITSQEYQDLVNKWWNKSVASDINKLKFVIGSIMNEVNTQLLPYHYQQAANRTDKQKVKDAKGNLLTPSNRNNPGPVSLDADTKRDFENLSKATGTPVNELLQI